MPPTPGRRADRQDRRQDRRRELLDAVEREERITRFLYGHMLQPDQIRGKTLQRLRIPTKPSGQIDWAAVGMDFTVRVEPPPEPRYDPSKKFFKTRPPLPRPLPDGSRRPQDLEQRIRAVHGTVSVAITAGPHGPRTTPRSRPSRPRSTSGRREPPQARPKRKLFRVSSGDNPDSPTTATVLLTPSPAPASLPHPATTDDEHSVFEPLSSPEDINKPRTKPVSLGMLGQGLASRSAEAAKRHEAQAQAQGRAAETRLLAPSRPSPAQPPAPPSAGTTPQPPDHGTSRRERPKPTVGTTSTKPTVATTATKPTLGTQGHRRSQGRERLGTTSTKPTVATTATKPTLGTTFTKPTVGTTSTKPTVATTATKPTLGTTFTKPTVGTTSTKPTVATTATKPTLGTTFTKPTVGTTSTKPTVAASPSRPVQDLTFSKAPMPPPTTPRILAPSPVRSPVSSLAFSPVPASVLSPVSSATRSSAPGSVRSPEPTLIIDPTPECSPAPSQVRSPAWDPPSSPCYSPPPSPWNNLEPLARRSPTPMEDSAGVPDAVQHSSPAPSLEADMAQPAPQGPSRSSPGPSPKMDMAQPAPQGRQILSPFRMTSDLVDFMVGAPIVAAERPQPKRKSLSLKKGAAASPMQAKRVCQSPGGLPLVPAPRAATAVTAASTSAPEAHPAVASQVQRRSTPVSSDTDHIHSANTIILTQRAPVKQPLAKKDSTESDGSDDIIPSSQPSPSRVPPKLPAEEATSPVLSAGSGKRTLRKARCWTSPPPGSTSPGANLQDGAALTDTQSSSPIPATQWRPSQAPSTRASGAGDSSSSSSGAPGPQPPPTSARKQRPAHRPVAAANQDDSGLSASPASVHLEQPESSDTDGDVIMPSQPPSPLRPKPAKLHDVASSPPNRSPTISSGERESSKRRSGSGSAMSQSQASALSSASRRLFLTDEPRPADAAVLHAPGQPRALPLPPQGAEDTDSSARARPQADGASRPSSRDSAAGEQQRMADAVPRGAPLRRAPKFSIGAIWDFAAGFVQRGSQDRQDSGSRSQQGPPQPGGTPTFSVQGRNHGCGASQEFISGTPSQRVSSGTPTQRVSGGTVSGGTPTSSAQGRAPGKGDTPMRPGFGIDTERLSSTQHVISGTPTQEVRSSASGQSSSASVQGGAPGHPGKPVGKRAALKVSVSDALVHRANAAARDECRSPARPSVVGRPGTPGRTGTSGRPGTPGRAGTSGRPSTPGRAGTFGRPGTPGRAGTFGHPGTPGRAGTSGRPGTPGRAGTSGRPGTPGRAGLPGRSSTPRRPHASSTSSSSNAPPHGPSASAHMVTPDPEDVDDVLDDFSYDDDMELLSEAENPSEEDETPDQLVNTPGLAPLAPLRPTTKPAPAAH
ncbi:nascent polypeptide-associated complex subunit alpha, muscle-specific form-like [Thrips palmi]|uniref:Nascent polypeptide-associated complex subunit alpha, muscle-specific form-like n=1 Tax=Thrips palmi TaxID=161013 RepID=A0A6P9A0H9_THRPL|nr:nascent polypeptide-associated complex subunit alpha, muscle-specific form-like [Thrips palmi]